jgi:hypothetical protein
MGAIIKGTEPPLYKTPYEAKKGVDYVCPDCKKDLILKKGEILRHHFAHKSSVTPCTYYDRPTESQMHKEAKHLIASRINNGDPLTIIRKCKNKGCDFEELHQITNAKAVEEYAFMHNDSHKKADIGIVVDDKFNYVIEVYHTHKTCEEDRPEPWCEVHASDTVKQLQNITSGKEFSINCIRGLYECISCITQKEIKEAIERERKIREAEEKILRETAERKRIEKEAEEKRIWKSTEKERKIKKHVDVENYNRGWIKYLDKEYKEGRILEEARKKKKYLIIYAEECKSILSNIRRTKDKCASCKQTYWCKKCDTNQREIYEKEIEKLISEWQEIMSEELPVQKENT